MLGHLKPQLCRLPSSARRQYRQLYCSLCYSLRRQFGLPASLLVSHEMTLSLAACSGEWETVDADCGCPARLFCRSRPVVLHDGIDRAARYSLLLAWLKLHDWESDSGSRWARALRRRLDPAVAPILAELSAETRASSTPTWAWCAIRPAASLPCGKAPACWPSICSKNSSNKQRPPAPRCGASSASPASCCRWPTPCW
ncbi:DUF5685 family protein, partial [Methylogaea oryzae]|uniref:DUF5685 family protein n=1 Tax=Methylogaea oryzae TaxID=1295382 RepID=UPI000AB943A0